jgi:hypothetical protein
LFSSSSKVPSCKASTISPLRKKKEIEDAEAKGEKTDLLEVEKAKLEIYLNNLKQKEIDQQIKEIEEQAEKT